MTPQQLKTLEIASAIVVVVGLIVWFSTPGDVIVAPLAVIAVGCVGAGIGQLVRRKQNEQSANRLADRVRAERARDDDRLSE